MNILEELQNVFDDVFEDKILISRNVKKTDIGEWDSLVHILLINEIETRFNIKISMEESSKISSIADLENCILNKVNK